MFIKVGFFMTWIRALLILIVPVACTHPGPESTENIDLVITNYDQHFNFPGNFTYAIPDSVIIITGNVFNDPNGNGKPDFLDSSYSIPVLKQVNQHLASYGWTRTNATNNPDVVVLVSSISTPTISYYYDWGYWSWWYPSLASITGWNYPDYYNPVYLSGYHTGSVFIQMVNHQGALQSNSVPVVWNCVVNGLAEGAASTIVSRVQTGIDAAFTQSPYLRH
jgi:hypothetical protein